MQKVKSKTSFLTGTHIKKGDSFDLYTMEEVCNIDNVNESKYKGQSCIGFARSSHGNSLVTKFSPIYDGEVLFIGSERDSK